MKLCYTNFGFFKVLHSAFIFLFLLILQLFIYAVKWITFEKGTGTRVTKRKYNRIITIMRYKIWLLRHFPKTIKFLGIYPPCKHAEKIFAHRYGM